MKKYKIVFLPVLFILILLGVYLAVKMYFVSWGKSDIVPLVARCETKNLKIEELNEKPTTILPPDQITHIFEKEKIDVSDLLFVDKYDYRTTTDGYTDNCDVWEMVAAQQYKNLPIYDLGAITKNSVIHGEKAVPYKAVSYQYYVCQNKLSDAAKEIKLNLGINVIPKITKEQALQNYITKNYVNCEYPDVFIQNLFARLGVCFYKINSKEVYELCWRFKSKWEQKITTENADKGVYDYYFHIDALTGSMLDSDKTKYID